MKPYVIMIAGPSGSGKSSFMYMTYRILSELGLVVDRLPMDDFYFSQDHLSEEGRDGLCFNKKKKLGHASAHGLWLYRGYVE